MQTWMAFVMTLMTAWVPTTSAACATVQAWMQTWTESVMTTWTTVLVLDAAAFATALVVYECGCEDIADGACDCDGNVLDECGVCGGTGVDADMDGICDDIDDCLAPTTLVASATATTALTGCADENACNYEGDTIDDGSCLYTDSAASVAAQV